MENKLLRRILDSPVPYFVLAGVLVVAAVLSQLEFSPPPRQLGSSEEISTLAQRDDLNVIFIVIDMLRADRLRSYGYARETSPVMDQLGEGGIRFARVEAQSSWTKASMASLWTGMYPERTGIQRFFHAMPQEALLPAEILKEAGYRTAEILKEAGYRTAGIWRNGWVANNFGFGQGFDLYIRPKQVARRHRVARNNPGVPRVPGTDWDATLSAIEFMTGSQSEKFFLYIHYMDVHQYLYTDVSPDFGSSFSDLYDSSIYWTDYNIGTLMTELQNLRLLQRTMVVIVSDHGEAFFEHGIEGHARNLYREVLETPWYIILPFELSPGIVVQTAVANVDVWPTLLDLLGLPGLPGAEGQSAVPLIAAAARGDEEALGASERSIFAQLDRSWGRVGAASKPSTSMVKGSHRLNLNSGPGPALELFDRSDDPKERRNLVGAQPELAASMRAELEEFIARPKTQWDEAPEIELNEMRQNQLRALGYVLQAAPGKKEQPAGDNAE